MPRKRASTGVHKVSLRWSLMASPYGPRGCLPPGVLRRLRGDLGNRLGPILRPTPRTAVPPADVGLRDLSRPRDLVDHRDRHEGRFVRGGRMARTETPSARGPLPRGAAVIHAPTPLAPAPSHGL